MRKKTFYDSNIIWNYIGTIFNMGINFFMLPFLLAFLNSDELGVWYVMVSFSNLASIFSFGFTPAFARNVAYCWNGARKLAKTGKEADADSSEGIDYHLLNTVLVTSRYLYLVFAVAGTLCIAVFGTVHIWRIAGTILTLSIKAGWIVFLTAIFLNIYYGYYSSYLIGIGCVKESNQIIVAAGILRITVMAVTMYLGTGILGAALAYLINGFVLRVSGKVVFDHITGLKKKLHKGQVDRVSLNEMKRCFETVWYNAWRDGIVSIADYLSTQVSTIVCSSYLSLEDTAMFSLSVQLVTAIGKIARSICNAYTPVFQRSYILGDQKTAREAQGFCIFAFTVVYVLGMAGLITVGIPLIRFIKPDAVLNPYLILGYGVYQFMLSYRNCNSSYMSCTNRLWYWKSFIITSFVSVVLYTVLLAFLGAEVKWIILISILCEGVYNFWRWPGLVNKELDLSYKDIIHLGTAQTRKMLGI